MRFVCTRSPFAWCTVLLVLCAARAPEPRYFNEPRYYAHDLFATQAKCVASRAYTCVQEVVFCPNGLAHYAVTDQIHFSRYEVRGELVTVRPSPDREVPEEVRFRLSADRESMKERETGTVWTRRREMEAWQAKVACRYIPHFLRRTTVQSSGRR